jgi:hypothetical protein
MSNIPFRNQRHAIAPRAALLLGLAAGAVVLSAFGRTAHAEASDDDPVAHITQLNRDAVAAYQAEKYEDARKMLKQALEVASAAGLDQHPIKARTHIHMGIVIINGFKQRDLGIRQFRKALEIQSDIALTKGLATPDLQAAFNDAVADAKADKKGPAAAAAAPAAPAPAPPPPPPPAAAPAAPEVPSTGLVHEAVTEGKQGSPISISVGVQSDLRFDKLVLAYKPAGASEFLGRTMKQVSEGTYAAEIPTTATAGGSVAYYVEAEDTGGAPVAARGSPEAPLVIALAGGGIHPAAVARKTEDEDADEDEGEAPHARYFVGLMVGSGAGWATGNGDTNADTRINPPGFAAAPLGQFAPEVGYWLKPNFMLSLQGRFQTVSGPTDIHATNGQVFHTANFAAAAFVKATWRFGEGKLRPMFSLAAGGGQVRHVVTFKALKDCGPSRTDVCVDTIAAGPIMLGPGAGLMWDINDHFSLVAQANTQLAFPNFTFNIDGNVGVALQF